LAAQFSQGYMSKHVNALKGYQPRFFVVNTEHGRLDYFLTKDDYLNSPNDYRGCIPLAGAEVAPREEDSVSFNVFASSGQVLQLKADTAKDRHKWVDTIRTAVQRLNEATMDPLAIRKSIVETSKGLSGNKKKKAQNAPKSALVLPTQEILNTREAINAAERALNEMSEIIANYPYKSLSTPQPAPSQTAVASNTNNNVVSSTPSTHQHEDHLQHGAEVCNYESMLRIKAFSVACLQDLKLCFDAVQSEYSRCRAS